MVKCSLSLDIKCLAKADQCLSPLRSRELARFRRDFLLYVNADIFWHGIVILLSKQQPKHTLVLYAASTLFSILVLAPYKWDKKWMRIKASVGMAVFGLSLLIYLFCPWAY